MSDRRKPLTKKQSSNVNKSDDDAVRAAAVPPSKTAKVTSSSDKPPTTQPGKSKKNDMTASNVGHKKKENKDAGPTVRKKTSPTRPITPAPRTPISVNKVSEERLRYYEELEAREKERHAKLVEQKRKRLERDRARRAKRRAEFMGTAKSADSEDDEISKIMSRDSSDDETGPEKVVKSVEVVEVHAQPTCQTPAPYIVQYPTTPRAATTNTMELTPTTAVATTSLPSNQVFTTLCETMKALNNATEFNREMLHHLIKERGEYRADQRQQAVQIETAKDNIIKQQAELVKQALELAKRQTEERESGLRQAAVSAGVSGVTSGNYNQASNLTPASTGTAAAYQQLVADLTETPAEDTTRSSLETIFGQISDTEDGSN